ncbi:hypothetical protein [Sporosarcina sp. Marseille-Q4943]|uniref:hypothetical protein n=1 Tax=Sporosarcina sp. Marseille-Q4943 TaxID=2942204 RepID=UPI00208DA6C3|nr:hypothetical protein [Sporosarcina sp. Marseille-Q4943]
MTNLDGLFDCNPLAIIRFNIDDVNEEHGEYTGSFSTWVYDELREYLEMKFGKVTLVEITETEVRYTYKRGKRGGLRQGKLLVTFAEKVAGLYEDRSEKYPVKYPFTSQ